MTWYKKKFTKKNKTSEVLCPICNSRMVIRKNTRTNQEFYGCSNYRGGCKGTRPVEKPQAVPQARPQNPIQQPNPQPVNNENSKPWVLSELLNTGEPVVARETIDKNWEIREENGKDTVFPRQVIQTYIKSIKDNFGKSITSKNPEELFRIYREINNQNVKEESKEKGIKGRIPEDKISPYQKQIETSFTDTQKNIMINALAGTGKAQPLDAKLLTPNGWILMGDVKIGDQIFGSDGLPHEVTGVFPQGEKEVFEVEMSDGSKTECCEEHLWLTETKQDRDLDRYHKQDLFSRAKVRKLSDLKNDLLYKGYPKHYIPIANPLEFNYQETGIDPYVMGVLLGDGSFRTGCVSFSSKDPEIIKYIEDSLPERLSCNPTGYGCDYRISGRVKGIRNPIISEIKKLNLWKVSSDKKFIPDVYKFNTIQTRVSILQGLLDTDGYISERTAEYCTTSYQLAKDVSFLVQSLGGTAKMTNRITSYT